MHGCEVFYAHPKKHSMQIEKEGLHQQDKMFSQKEIERLFDDSSVNDICGSCQQNRYVCPFVTHHVLSIYYPESVVLSMKLNISMTIGIIVCVDTIDLK